MLYNGSDTIRDVEWVIFDEVHYVNDEEVIMSLIYQTFFELKGVPLLVRVRFCTRQYKKSHHRATL